MDVTFYRAGRYLTRTTEGRDNHLAVLALFKRRGWIVTRSVKTT